jgi:predicted ATPase
MQGCGRFVQSRWLTWRGRTSRSICQRYGIFIFDELESALSLSRQIEFLKLLRAMERSGICQVIMATHAPLLMAYP